MLALALIIWLGASHFSLPATSCEMVVVIVYDVRKAIMDVLLTKYIKLPTGNQAMEIVRGFAAIDGSHIPIIPPHDSPTGKASIQLCCTAWWTTSIDF